MIEYGRTVQKECKENKKTVASTSGKECKDKK
jgi:hypothetical protein